MKSACDVSTVGFSQLFCDVPYNRKPLLLYRRACGYFQRVTSVFFCIYLPHIPVSAWSPGFSWLNEMPVFVLTIRQAILSTAGSFIVKHIGEPKGPAACIFCRNNDKIIYRPINFVTWASFFVVQHWHAWNLATEWFRVFFFWQDLLEG